MQLDLDTIRANEYLIRAYGPDEIMVKDTAYNHSIVVCIDQAPSPWQLTTPNTITSSDIAALLRIVVPEIVLIGTGTRHNFPPAAALVPLLEAKIGYEIMDTAAACRTYNVLASEGRRVVAGLILTV